MYRVLFLRISPRLRPKKGGNQWRRSVAAFGVRSSETTATVQRPAFDHFSMMDLTLAGWTRRVSRSDVPAKPNLIWSLIFSDLLRRGVGRLHEVIDVPRLL